MNSTQEESINNANQGSIRTLIDKIIITYAQEDELIQKVIESRLFLNGIRGADYTNDTPDDTQVLKKLIDIEKDLAKIFA